MTQDNRLVREEILETSVPADRQFEIHLLTALKNGDRKGYEILYTNYSAALYGVIFRIIKHKEMAEDILSEAFVKITRCISQYDASKGRFFTWILNITKNLTLDKLRSKQYHNDCKTSRIDDVTNIGSFKSSFSINPAHIDIRELTGKLLPLQKQLIDLAFFQGYTYAEIAEELNIPLGTVKTRIRKAINTLREIYNFNSRVYPD